MTLQCGHHSPIGGIHKVSPACGFNTSFSSATMSLPPAAKDISEHPQSGSVTAPTDRQTQEEDIDRKACPIPLHICSSVDMFPSCNFMV